jgi:hypothetical protein
MIVDAVARRYGVLPHVLLELEPWQLSMAVAAWRTGEAASAEACKHIARDGMVFPVVIVGGR